MSPPERRETPAGAPPHAGAPTRRPRSTWLVGLAAVLVLVVIATHGFSASGGAAGIAVGQRIPPFAVPLALGPLTGDANVATRAGEDQAGRVPACSVSLAQALNICRAYARGPLVLALFVNGGGCASVLADLQRLAAAYPGLQIAAVAIRGDRGALRALVRRERLGFPVGWDRDGALADLYRMSSCPQISFVRPGGVVAEPALLGQASPAVLEARVARLLAAGSVRGRARADGARVPA